MATETNKMRWDMESIFPGGSASPEFEKFREGVAAKIKAAVKEAEGLPRELVVRIDGRHFGDQDIVVGSGIRANHLVGRDSTGLAGAPG